MKERAALVECVRSEVVGPSRSSSPAVAGFLERVFRDPVARRKGPLAWKPGSDDQLEEVLYFDGESPNRKYGSGMLHPEGVAPDNTQTAAEATDTLGVEALADDQSVESTADGDETFASDDASDEDFDVPRGSVRRSSTMGISVCMSLDSGGGVEVLLPSQQRFTWQSVDDTPFPVNGRYERCHRHWTDDRGSEHRDPVWRRQSAVATACVVRFSVNELKEGRPIRKAVATPQGTPISLAVDCFPRRIKKHAGHWLITVVLRNLSHMREEVDARELVLYQALFGVKADRGKILPYPESQRPFENFDSDEKSLALLYRDSATYGIGHGCAAAWDAPSGAAPELIYADVMPGVELPSMTPDILINGRTVPLGMRDLADLAADGRGLAWEALGLVRKGYEDWISSRREEVPDLPPKLRAVASHHLDLCQESLHRIDEGIKLLRSNKNARDAFRLANLAMLLQQIATKQLRPRGASWNQGNGRALIDGSPASPWDIFEKRTEDGQRIGSWRAFQIAFLLMSLPALSDPSAPDREVVDLIWFPTGGGKTEAYLAAMAFYMFFQRLKATDGVSLASDGTNVLMRYTLRMLTTQQFQRAASLICAMEEIRRNPARTGCQVPGRQFSLGLWIGGGGSPNKCDEARTEVGKYLKGYVSGNPLVLTECPWCRAPIGKIETGGRGKKASAQPLGIANDASGPRLLCPDPNCAFGVEDPRHWLPVEVIDERIYGNPPSLIIATADKFAMLAYRPEAGAIFGRRRSKEGVEQIAMPPGLIIQDELHLISGPLGTMYALYEGVFEQLCTLERPGHPPVKPKIVASTATIRGADEQVRVLYGRQRTRLFPSPALSMSDSFFGRYATDERGRLRSGRLYVGVHAVDHGSILTTQVRTFAAALYRPAGFEQDKRDPWWTLLAFYNSIRELGGARTLFDSDIRSRLKFLFNREGLEGADHRRNLRLVDELTSRLSQPEIVGMMDRLARPYQAPAGEGSFDACLASNIIEVGVDIDRLSLMGVIGQPKTTSTYIQVTGRVGRRWQDRPGLIFTIYNPSKSRDRSHFEQFHGYHRRLYERVEPTSATPFAASAIQRGCAGAAMSWIRQQVNHPVNALSAHEPALNAAFDLLEDRCRAVQSATDVTRSLQELQRLRAELLAKWRQNPQHWEQFPQSPSGEYLMLWPGQFATMLQELRGVKIPTSMRQVDRTGELVITSGYAVRAAEAELPIGTRESQGPQLQGGSNGK